VVRGSHRAEGVADRVRRDQRVLIRERGRAGKARDQRGRAATEYVSPVYSHKVTPQDLQPAGSFKRIFPIPT
jgi:hypothetical protein